MSSYSPVRGIDPSQELHADNLMRDIRPTSMRVIDSLRSVNTMVLTLVAHAVVVWQFPAIGTFALLSASLLAWWGLTRKENAPIKMPIQCGLLDPNELNPSTKKPRKASGIFHIGTTLPMGSPNVIPASRSGSPTATAGSISSWWAPPAPARPKPCWDLPPTR
jgi:hypothetical protein